MIEPSFPAAAREPRLFGRSPLTFFLLARVAATVAFQIQAVAVGWQMYALTGSAFYLGLVGLAQFLPMFALTLAVGHAADRHDRRGIVRACQVVEALGTGLLAAACLAGRIDKGSILVIVSAIGAARAFEGPSMQSLLPALVSVEAFPRAAAWSASAMQVATIVGPALGGFLYALSPTSVFAAAAALYLGASVLISLVRVDRKPPRKESATLKSVFAGIAFIKDRQLILGAISLDLFAVLLGGATALLPIYAKDILFTGSMGLGLLRAAPALGALSMSLFLARRPLRRMVGRTMFLAGSPIRHRHHLLRLLEILRPLALRPGRPRRLGRHKRGGKAVARAAADARRDAGQGERGELDVHRHLEPVGRIRVGPDGRLVRYRARRPDRRHRYPRRGRAVDPSLPQAREGRQDRACGRILSPAPGPGTLEASRHEPGLAANRDGSARASS